MNPRRQLLNIRARRERLAKESAAAAIALRAAVDEATRAGISRVEIADLAGVSRQAVYDIEKAPDR